VTETSNFQVIPQAATSTAQNINSLDTFANAVPTDRLSMYHGPAPFILSEYGASSEMLHFCEKFARHLITRAMAVSELDKIFS
jgi:hypothetical protein